MIIVFDLDDTLYPELDFVKSGYRYIANQINPDEPQPVYNLLWSLFCDDRQYVFNRLLDQMDISYTVQELISMYRFHTPDIAMSGKIVQLLNTLKECHPIALITDGPARMQKQKYDVLGLDEWIEKPVFSGEFDTHKPDPMLYEIIENAYPEHQNFIYVADNPKKDFITPIARGWDHLRLKREDGVHAYHDYDGPNEVYSESEMISWLLDRYGPSK